MRISLCLILSVFYLLTCYGQEEFVYKVERLNNKINTADYDEINPVISRDGLTIYFTRVGHPDFNRTIVNEGQDMSSKLSYGEYYKHLKSIYKSLDSRSGTDIVNNQFNQDVWIAHWTGNDFDKIVHPDYPLNSALPNSVCSITPKANELIIINEFYKDGSMYKGFSTINSGPQNSWQFPKPIYIYDFFSLTPDVNLTMSDDGQVIILSLNRPSSRGTNDLYVCFKVDFNLYSSPLPLSSVINTQYRETTPYISRDGQFLYFSSNRPNGFGGNDIYVARRLDESWQEWSKPELLPLPINSSADDSQPFVNESSGFIYFTSKREGTSDIFKATYHPVESKNRTKSLVFHVINAFTGQPIESQIVIGDANDGFYSSTINTTEGRAAYEFISPTRIMVKPKKPDYISVNTIIDLDSLFLNNSTVQEHTLYLEPKNQIETFSLENIYFLRSTATIDDNSYEALNELITVLKYNQDIKMKIIGHTDNVGSEVALNRLSNDRSLAIKEYLVKIGQIDPNRILTEGKGKTQPLNDNSTEEKKSKNRRVEITVFK